MKTSSDHSPANAPEEPQAIPSPLAKAHPPVLAPPTPTATKAKLVSRALASAVVGTMSTRTAAAPTSMSARTPTGSAASTPSARISLVLTTALARPTTEEIRLSAVKSATVVVVDVNRRTNSTQLVVFVSWQLAIVAKLRLNVSKSAVESAIALVPLDMIWMRPLEDAGTLMSAKLSFLCLAAEEPLVKTLKDLTLANAHPVPLEMPNSASVSLSKRLAITTGSAKRTKNASTGNVSAHRLTSSTSRIGICARVPVPDFSVA